MMKFFYYQKAFHGGWNAALSPNRPAEKKVEGGTNKITGIVELKPEDMGLTLAQLEDRYPPPPTGDKEPKTASERKDEKS